MEMFQACKSFYVSYKMPPLRGLQLTLQNLYNNTSPSGLPEMRTEEKIYRREPESAELRREN